MQIPSFNVSIRATRLIFLKLNLACLCWVTLLLPSTSQAAVFTVGSLGSCSFNNIPAAISAAASAPGSDIIRIMTGTYNNQALTIQEQNLTLIGGFSDCTQTTPSGAPSIISGASNGGLAALQVINLTTTQTNVQLQHLRITGAVARGLVIRGYIQASLSGVIVDLNSGISGGGGYFAGLDAGHTLNIQTGQFLGIALEFSNNSATHGGGFYCDAFAFVSAGNMTIQGNQAQLGGGVYISPNCQISQSTFPSTLVTSGIRQNSASFDGGGVYLNAGGSFGSSQFSENDPKPSIIGNIAGRHGGGIFVAPNGFLGPYNLLMQDNTAGNSQSGNGGAIYMSANASGFLEDGGEGTRCSLALPCVSLIGNRAGSVSFIGSGGAIYQDAGSFLSLNKALLRGNQANNGAVASLFGTNTELLVRSSIIEHNISATHSFRVASAAKLRFEGVTIGDEDTDSGVVVLAGGNLIISSSILYDPGAFLVSRFPSTSNQVTLNCVMAHGAITAEVGSAVIANPLFVNPSIGDYRLLESSPAIDACDAGLVFGSADTDFSENPRGVDFPNISNGAGAFDLGALENDKYLFINGFE